MRRSQVLKQYNPVKAKGRESMGVTDEVPIQRNPEQRLAVAKIHLHLQDLLNIGPAASREERVWNREKAWQWFFEASDFWWWAEAAGFIAEKVAVRIVHLYKRGQFDNPDLFRRIKAKMALEDKKITLTRNGLYGTLVDEGEDVSENCLGPLSRRTDASTKCSLSLVK